MARFNLIGFNFPRGSKFEDGWGPVPEPRYCPIHPGTRVVHFSDEKDPDILRCPRCGCTPILEKDTVPDEGIKPKHNKQTTQIISVKGRKKKYYDKQGNEITDETLLADIARGVTVISYREDKVEGDVKKPKRHVVKK